MKITKNDYNLLKELYPHSLDKCLKKINNNYPVQYLIGNVSFYGYPIIVNKNVLIPRFETEYLVEKTINYIKKLNIKKAKIFEIGTGSGCISIALAKNLPDSNITAIDISYKALKVAKKNKKNNNVVIKLIKKDIFKTKIPNNYDVIISNPPYIAYNEEVDDSTKYEPQKALFAPDNGLAFYKKIINDLKEINFKLCAFEIGMTQKESLINYIKKTLPNITVECQKDYNNRDRYLFIINE